MIPEYTLKPQTAARPRLECTHLPPSNGGRAHAAAPAQLCLRQAELEPTSAGPRTIQWDRRTASGAVAQPGLYFCDLRAEGHRSIRELVLIR